MRLSIDPANLHPDLSAISQVQMLLVREVSLHAVSNIVYQDHLSKRLQERLKQQDQFQLLHQH